MSVNAKLYVLYALNVEYHQAAEPRLSQGACLYFSSRETAEDAARLYRHAYDCLYNETAAIRRDLYCLMLDEYELDKLYPHKLSSSVYDSEGLLKEQMWLNEEDVPYQSHGEASAFAVGDIVEAPIGDYLRPAIVLACPPVANTSAGNAVGENLHAENPLDDDENYYSLLVYPSLDVEYVYAPLVFEPSKPLTEEVEVALQAAFESYSQSEKL